MTLSIPLVHFRTQQRSDLPHGALFHPVDSGGIGPLHVVAGTRKAKCRIALGGSQPFTLRGMASTDGTLPALHVPVESLQVRVQPGSHESGRHFDPGVIHLTDECAFLLVVQPGIGGQTNNFWVSLTDWTASVQRPEDYALVTAWQLVAETRDGPVVVAQLGQID
jgi:hypothetical protein